MKYKVFSLLLALAMVFSLAACSKSEEGGSSAGSSNTAMIMVGIAMTGSEETNPYGAKLESRLKDVGYSVEIAYSDKGKQTDQISDMVKDGASLLIVEPDNIDDLKKALESISVDVSDVSVIALDAPVDSASVNAYVGVDYQDLGKQQAEFIAETLQLENMDEDDDPLSIEFLSDQSGCGEKALAGALSVLQKYLDEGKLEVLTDNTTASSIEAADATEWAASIFTTTYESEDLNAVLCFGREQGEAVAEEVFHSYTGNVFPLIASVGNSAKSVEQLSRGYMGMVSTWDTDEVINEIVDAVAAVVNSAGKPEREHVVTSTAITHSNYEALLIESGLYTANEDGTFTKN